MKTGKVVICYKDFSTWTGYSTVGLCVAAWAAAKELLDNGIDACAISVAHNIDLYNQIRELEKSLGGIGSISHLIIMAPWLSPLDLKSLLKRFPYIQFVVKSHSNVAGLHGDHRGIGNFREYADLTFEFANLRVAGNSQSFVDWFSEAYDVPVLLLPDLYPCESIGIIKGKVKKRKVGGVVRIGAFGAQRIEKNFLTAGAAAISIQQKLNKQINGYVPVELHINSGGEHSGQRLAKTLDEMTQGIPGFTLVKHKWMEWKNFIKVIQKMDLLLQPSFTETFNIVTADGISNGVPSVVSTAVKWAPLSWVADSDNPDEVANTGMRLLTHPEECIKGAEALIAHNKWGLEYWKQYLFGEDQDL